VKQIQNQDVVV